MRHAIAIDEARHDFQPEVFREDTGHMSLQQRWFVGVHSNVGGGLRWDGLANCALRRIAEEAAAAGLEMRKAALPAAYINQFVDHPSGDHDDGPDSAEGCWRSATKKRVGLTLVSLN